MKKEINTLVDKLNEKDVYSLLLFSLYKFTDIPEYSSLSELIYILDKKPFLKLCEYFGGQTIKIPTTHELEIMLYALLLYQYINIEGQSFETALARIDAPIDEKKKVKQSYNKLIEILKDYKFAPRQ